MNLNDASSEIFVDHTIGIRISNTHVQLVDHNCVNPGNLKFVTESAEFPHFIHGRQETDIAGLSSDDVDIQTICIQCAPLSAELSSDRFIYSDNVPGMCRAIIHT